MGRGRRAHDLSPIWSFSAQTVIPSSLLLSACSERTLVALSAPVILSEAKDPYSEAERSFAPLRMTTLGQSLP
jgi:hypothetical protein